MTPEREGETTGNMTCQGRTFGQVWDHIPHQVLYNMGVLGPRGIPEGSLSLAHFFGLSCYKRNVRIYCINGFHQNYSKWFIRSEESVMFDVLFDVWQRLRFFIISNDMKTALFILEQRTPHDKLINMYSP